MDKRKYDFAWDGQEDELKISGENYKAGKFLCTDFPGQIFYKSTQFDVFIPKDALKERITAKYNPNDVDSNVRAKDYKKAKKHEKPFEIYDTNGQPCPFPSRMLQITDKDYNQDLDKDQQKLWKDVASYLAKADVKAGTNVAYARFVLGPSAAAEVWFSPLAQPVLNVTKELLQAVIDSKKDNHGKWTIKAVTYNEAVALNLKPVGTNFLNLYIAWMKQADYADLWNSHGNPPQLPFAFPVDNPATLAQFTALNTGLKTGKQTVEGVAIPLNTTKLQSTSSTRKEEGDNGLKIMGKSATDFVPLWGANITKTGMMKHQAEWLHRSSYAFGGLAETRKPETSDDPNNMILGSTECNTDMMRAEGFIRTLLSEHNKKKFKGSLTTICTRAGQVTRRDKSMANVNANLPTFLPNYSWLCFELVYRFTMPAASSPLGCDLNADTTFEPWSLYVPLAIEPRMDNWLIKHMRQMHDPVTTSKKKTGAKKSALELPPLPIEPDLEIPTLAWKAAQAGLPEIELPGLVVKNPRVLAPEPPADARAAPLPLGSEADIDIPVPEQGFVLQGEVELFETSIVGQFEKWMGPPPDDVETGIEPPRWERVTLTEDFHLSSVLPLLKDTPYDVITFRNVSFWHQNYLFDRTRSVGWHFDADWVIEESCGVLHEVLRTILQVDKPILSIRTSLGFSQDWSAPLSVHSFTLEGMFAGLTLSPVSGLRLSSIGVRLLGIRGLELGTKPRSTLSYGFGVFGTMEIDVPGSIIPLHLDYEMGVTAGTVNMSAELSGKIWDNALGIKKLQLEDVAFLTSFSLASGWKSLSFSISATFWYLTSQAVLSGTFLPGTGQLALSAEFGEFGTHEIDSIFYTFFGDSLTLPSYDIHIGSASLSFVSGSGIALALQNVQVAGHTALDVAVALSKDGVQLSGAITTDKLTFGEVPIRNAALTISFWTEEKKKKVDLMLGGTMEVEFLKSTVEAAVHLYPGEKGVEWTIIAGLTAHEKAIAISDVVSAIDKGSYLDLSLRDCLIIAASKDDPDMSLAFHRPYVVRQGIQVAAVIDSIPVLNNLLRTDVSGLMLSAGWSKVTGFDLKVMLPASTTLDLGHGIRSSPISLEIRTQPLQLAVIAGIVVPVKDGTPLDFSFALAASITKASASADMQGWWVKPFGVDKLKIGPVVTLSIEIIYQQFLSTGTPSGFGVAGGFMIGKTEARAVMNITEDPKGQLLAGSLKKLDVSDVITFGAEMVEADIPKIPDLLNFEELSLYICPFGVVLGRTTYPAGFSFKADLLFLKHRANIECTIDKVAKAVALNGGVDNFELGPLSVRGSSGPRATIGCQLGVSTQDLVVDGVVTLFDAQVQIYVNMQFLPNPTLKFHTLLQFGGILTYQLDAELLGSIDNLKDADFSLTSSFENHLLDYVAQQLVELLEAVKVGATKGLQTAQEKTEEAKKKWQAGVDDARHKLDEARAKWQSYEQSVRSSSQPIIDHWFAEIDRLENNIKEAQKTFDDAMAVAQNAMEKANRDRGAAMADAQHAVTVAKEKMKEGIKVAQDALDSANAAVSSAFGDAIAKIKDAENDVAQWQREIDDVENTIKEYADAPIYQPWKKAAIPALGTYLGVLAGKKLLAQGALAAAQGILKGTEFVTKEGAVGSAKAAVAAAEKLGESGLDAANVTLAATDKATQFTVDAARAVVKATETGVHYGALQGAILALKAFKAGQQAAYDGAVAAIEGLMKATEYLAFTAAEAGLSAAEHLTGLLDAAKATLKLAEDAFGAIMTVMQEIVKFGAKAINIESVSLSGTLRGAMGLGGANSRPLRAAVKGYILGKSFNVEIVFNPKAIIDFLKSLFDEVLNILKGKPSVKQYALPLEDIGEDLDYTSVPEPFTAFRPLVSKDELHWLEGLLPPPLSDDGRKHFPGPISEPTDNKEQVTFVAPLIAVQDQVKLLPFAIARSRFIQYRVEGNIEAADGAEKQGLVALPAGPFTAGPRLSTTA